MNESPAGSPAMPPECAIGPYERRTSELARGHAEVKHRLADAADARLVPVSYRDANGGWIVGTHDRLGIARPQAARRPQEADR